MKKLVAVLASTLILGTALAEEPTKVASASETHMDAARDLKVESHIKEMHASLKITAAQETQWAGVAQTMRENARDLDAAIDKREAASGTATAIDNLNSYADVAQTHADGVKKLATAFTGLYASLSDEQKQEADEEFAHRMHAGKKMAKG